MHEVIRTFYDLTDNNFVYNVGDSFPRVGLEVSQDRIEELSGNNNKQGTPLIKPKEKPIAKRKKVKKED